MRFLVLQWNRLKRFIYRNLKLMQRKVYGDNKIKKGTTWIFLVVTMKTMSTSVRRTIITIVNITWWRYRSKYAYTVYEVGTGVGTKRVQGYK